MAINNNILTNIGDIMLIKSKVSLNGNIQLSSFSDDVSGETADRYFIKKFKYSFDELNWSDFLQLNISNVSQINGNSYGFIFFEFYYERAGSDENGTLELNDVQIDGQIIINDLTKTETDKSILKSFSYDNAETFYLTNNLLRKIYYNGIIPNYLDRGYSVNDEDFINFWRAFCFYLASIINYLNSFDNILKDRNLLSEFLKQKGLFFTENEITMSDLTFLANNLQSEIRKRGTISVFKEKEVSGEMLRLINKNPYDEFLFEVPKKEHMGFFVNKSSSTYHGTNRSTQLNKTPDNTEYFETLDNYKNFGDVFLNSTKELVISGNNASGIGEEIENAEIYPDGEFLIPVDDEIDYEITFQIKRTSDCDVELNFGVLGYNRNNVLKNLSFNQIGFSQITKNYFLKDTKVSDIAKVPNVWYNIRGIIYASKSNQLSDADSKLNINLGKNLKFNDSFVKVEKISVCLYSNTNSLNQDFLIKDFKIRPLIKGKNILKRTIGIEKVKSSNQYNGRGLISGVPSVKIRIITESPFIKNPAFIQQGQYIYSYFKNNNYDYSNNQIQNLIEKFLIPYQHRLEMVPLEPKVDDKQLLT